jgi:hypothetical protein
LFVAAMLLITGLAGCGTRESSQGPTQEFSNWREELAYLKAQANTTPAQFKRLKELQVEEFWAKQRHDEALNAPREAWQKKVNVVYDRMREADKALPDAKQRSFDQLWKDAEKEVGDPPPPDYEAAAKAEDEEQP